jgi:Zn-dependent protease with chaperone function
VRLLVFNLSAHFCGAFAGSLVFGSAFGASALFFPAILLAPAWVVGAVLLFTNHWQKKKETLADSRKDSL